MKVPEPRRLPSGSWFIQLRLGGVSVPVTAPTAKECKRQAEQIKVEHRLNRKPAAPAPKVTLGDVLDSYIDVRRGVRSPSTLRGYKKIRETHFQKYMDKPCKSINFQRMVQEDSMEFSPKSVQNAWSLTRSALTEAGYVAPRVFPPQPEKKEKAWLTAEQIPVFLDAIRGDLCETAALLGLHSLRLSEILGLRWKDVDVNHSIIHIRGALVIGENDKPIRKDTNKNLTSRRDVPIMIPRLQELLVSEISKLPDPDSPVVPYVDATVYNHITKACVNAGLPKVSPHGLRHSFASLALHVGLSERECMELGGWSNPVAMHTIYTHISASDRLKAQNKMAKFYSSEKENANENANEVPETQ